MLGKKSQGKMMSCGCSPGGEQGDADKGVLPGTDVNGAHEARRFSLLRIRMDKIKFIGKKGLRQKDKILLVWFSLLLLLPGEFIRNTGPGSDASWAFLQTVFSSK